MPELATEPQTSHTEVATTGHTTDDGGDWTAGQSGAVSFAELVRAHYAWDRSLRRREDGNGNRATLDTTYRKKLAEFQEREGSILNAYWATKRASAVALTAKSRKPSGARDPFTDRDAIIRLHRATDWYARESAIAELLHHCDTLAIRVGEILRGTSQRIAMQWIYAVQSHLLGFVERTDGKATADQVREVVETQKRELVQIEKYYDRAAEKAARIVYFRGMLWGSAAALAVAGAIAAVLSATGWMEAPYLDDAQIFFASYVSGMVGALISVMTRMTSSSKFNLDYEVGRKPIRHLGANRPFIGAAFGVAIWFLIESGLPRVELPERGAEAFFYYGIIAFLAGFSERHAKVILGNAERTLEEAFSPTPARPPVTAPPPGATTMTARETTTLTSNGAPGDGDQV